MFPTQVGMNRFVARNIRERIYVPHAGGDEPQGDVVLSGTSICSPRRWG